MVYVKVFLDKGNISKYKIKKKTEEVTQMLMKVPNIEIQFFLISKIFF